jgi:predicted AAA+ superfamily ATPase
VINLQTNFGGGKTHSMLALWHLAGGQPLTAFDQDVQELLVRD